MSEPATHDLFVSYWDTTGNSCSGSAQLSHKPAAETTDREPLQELAVLDPDGHATCEPLLEEVTQTDAPAPEGAYAGKTGVGRGRGRGRTGGRGSRGGRGEGRGGRKTTASPPLEDAENDEKTRRKKYTAEEELILLGVMGRT